MNIQIQPVRRHRTRRLSAAALAVALAVSLPGGTALAHGVTAGTLINNTATANYTEGGAVTTVTSNTVSLRVDEVLDVAVVALATSDQTTGAGSTGQVSAFTLTNEGNGPESFTLDALGITDGGGFAPTVTGIAIDANGNGSYDPGVDTVVAAGAASPILAADASVTVFVLSSIPGGAADGQRGAVRLTAAAATGTGTAGTAFAGRGEGGGDALVGTSGADADAKSGFVVSRGTVALLKSATVVDPFGGARVVPGAIVTYAIAATVSGSGTVPDLAVTDAIPDGTDYQPGTLTLEGAALSDGADGDAGTASATGVAVAVGPIAAGSTRTIRFKVKIK